MAFTIKDGKRVPRNLQAIEPTYRVGWGLRLLMFGNCACLALVIGLRWELGLAERTNETYRAEQPLKAQQTMVEELIGEAKASRGRTREVLDAQQAEAPLAPRTDVWGPVGDFQPPFPPRTLGKGGSETEPQPGVPSFRWRSF